jgi:hypothetical protein
LKARIITHLIIYQFIAACMVFAFPCNATKQ